jgi:UDP-hydrolysing UDP-N-acetyl-D-glucosamine 2-epimerase
VVTFHPVTLAENAGMAELQAVLAALAALPEDVGMVVTLPNADTGGRKFGAMMQDFAAGRANVSLHASLGQQRYYSLLAQVDAMVGNSSSGLSEAPSFGIATVNIGDRQSGRLRAASVIDCPAEESAIVTAIDRALTTDYSGVVNPYGDGQAAARIIAVLRDLADPRTLLRKPFVTWDTP